MGQKRIKVFCISDKQFIVFGKNSRPPISINSSIVEGLYGSEIRLLISIKTFDFPENSTPFRMVKYSPFSEHKENYRFLKNSFSYEVNRKEIFQTVHGGVVNDPEKNF